MKKSRVFLAVILLIAIVLRFYQLGNNPLSLDWDEASLGYNAYSILKTGNDEYGNSWPFSIRSFNDYKPPLYTYLAILPIGLLGLNEYAVRLPSAVFGVLAVAGIYFLSRELTWKHKNSIAIALISSFLLAVSPWHLQFSRAAFEANIALTCYVWALAFFFMWKRLPKAVFLLGASLSAVAALYAYHSARLVVPIVFIILGLFSFKQVFQTYLKQTLVSLSLAIVLLFPLLVITFRGSTSQRFNTVSIFTNPGEFSREAERFERNQKFLQEQPNIIGKIFYNQKVVLAQVIGRNYFEHFNYDFLFAEADNNLRHHAYGMGLLYVFEFPLLLTGGYALFRARKNYNGSAILTILLAGPLAASITASTPHAIRSYMMLPGLILLSAIGAIELYSYTEKRIQSSFIKFSLLATSGLLIFANIFVYLNLYYVISPLHAAPDWQYGYKQLVEKVSQIESEYNQVIITNYYDQPHIYFAFYEQINPVDYQTYAETAPQGFGKYVFKDIKDPEDFEASGNLVIADPESTPGNAEIIDVINFPDGSVAFNLIQT